MKIDILNVNTQEIRKSMIMKMKKGTAVILVFDTDGNKNKMLMKNIAFLKKQKAIVSSVVCVPQCQNLEDELVRSCHIKHVQELTSSKSRKDFKRDFLHMKQEVVEFTLRKYDFSIQNFWNTTPTGVFEHIPNDAFHIKIQG